MGQAPGKGVRRGGMPPPSGKAHDGGKDGGAPRIWAPRVRTIDLTLLLASCLLLVLFLRAASRTAQSYEVLERAVEKYARAELAANQFKHASDDLTTQMRMFTVTEDPKHLDAYFEEAFVSRRREDAVETLERYLAGTDAYRYLEAALRWSDELMGREYRCMALVVAARGIVLEGCAAEELGGIVLDPTEASLSPDSKVVQALALAHGAVYQRYDDLIDENVAACIADLDRERTQVQAESERILSGLLLRQRILAALLVSLILLLGLTVGVLVLAPLGLFVRRIRDHQPLPLSGSYELRYLASAYNVMYGEYQKDIAHLRHEAEHDPLTGLYDRGAFMRLRQHSRAGPNALILIDVDEFKGVNDTYGHDMGDKVLRKVAALLAREFRSTDYPCRVGGDEFAVILTGVSADRKDLIRQKMGTIRDGLLDVSDGLPPVTLSVGAAFSSRGRDAYKDADKALYRVKEHGRDGCAFYGEPYRGNGRPGPDGGTVPRVP